ncbi:stromelysin-2-like isoform X2 [Ahaetulla prasina]|uniref:stromelysin-2-like isoform X2 n=1 Tax=Ahaetulla prasina TaxID=499056 RepID=UPI0026492E3F|nr:stromelysin-2-like isoform X2 [Ahaetulla prasina]
MRSLWLVLFGGAIAFALPVKHEKEKMLLMQRYLEKYYNFTSNGQQVFRSRISSSMANKIREMQAFIGLEVTGDLDSNTLQAIQKPRCGNPDVGQFAFFAGQPKWQKKHLTYRILNYTPDMKRVDVDEIIDKAFRVWSRVTPLTFEKVLGGNADIFISFHSGGTNLFYTAVHEFGHSLGLFHSRDPNAVMTPTYKTPTANQPILSQDDIAGIQYLYGASSNPPQDPVEKDEPRKPNSPGKPALPSACNPGLTFDAVTTFRGEIMFFWNKYFWRKLPQYTEIELNLISEFWSFLPSGVDAASENNEKDETFLFKGNQFWVVKGDYVLPGYPKTIHSLGFPKDVTKIDAAVFSANEQKTYYFSSDRYWSYDEDSKTMNRRPQRIQDGFPGISGKIDAVFHYNDVLYFFKGRNQYEFDPNTRRVTRILKANSWFSC